MNEKQQDFIQHIIANSDGSEKRIGDFVIRHDYGVNLYYEGKGGAVVVPEEAANAGMSDTFVDAKKITSLRFPGTFREVRAVPFGSRASLQTLMFDEGVERLPETNFFANCKVLENVTLPQSLQYLGAGAFKKTPWYQKTVEKDGGCYYLGRFLVDSDEEIESTEVREGTTMICGKAFHKREKLTEVTVPEGVRIIGAQAFLGCSALEKIVLPESVTTVESWSFAGCRSLRHIEINAAEADVSADAFGSEKFMGLCYPEFAYIPTEIKGTTEQMKFFAYCYLTSRDRFSAELRERNDADVKKRKAKLLELIMGQGNLAALRNIAPLSLSAENIDAATGKAQSSGSAQMTAFLLDWKAKHFDAVGLAKQAEKELNKDPMSAGELKKIWNTKKLPDGTLGITSYKGNESEIAIPACIGKANVTVICREAFYASEYPSPIGKIVTDEQRAVREAIRSVRIPEGVTKIEISGFAYCDHLEHVYMPASMKDANSWAFSGCKSLTIHAPAGSYAEQYAKENNIPFVAE